MSGRTSLLVDLQQTFRLVVDRPDTDFIVLEFHVHIVEEQFGISFVELPIEAVFLGKGFGQLPLEIFVDPFFSLYLFFFILETILHVEESVHPKQVRRPR